MKTLMNTKKIALLLFVSLLGMSCSKSEDAPIPVEPAKSITAILALNPDYSKLVKALVDTKLDATLNGAGTFTVFAPNNAAFDAFVLTLGTGGITNADLKNILLNHVLGSVAKSTDLKTGYVKTLADGPIANTKMSMFVDLASGVKLNAKASVTKPDIMASNGVIHYVDKVITLPTIVEAAIANPAFSTLVKILNSTSGTYGNQKPVLEALGTASAPKPFTVLAPTDIAFSAATSAGGFITTSTNEGQYTNVLKYHVIITGNFQAKDFLDKESRTTYLGKDLIVDKSTADVKFKDLAGDLSKVVIADVQCANGIVHAIGGVLQPK
jgi:uncharacterized surface protein with fasciclin (FAS1) repeats